MGDNILKIDCEVTYDAKKGIEIRLRHGGSLSGEFTQHLARAGKELSLALQHLAKTETESAPQKVRTKIEIEEARDGKD